MTEALLLNAAAIAGLMLVIWLISIPLRDVSIIDLVWGPGFVVVSWVTFLTSRPAARSLLPVLLVTIWGLRLGCYLAWRNHGKPEDYRYREMRQRHGRRFPIISLLTVFALQGAVMWIVSLPLQTCSQSATDIPWLKIAGTALWAVGVLFETIGDWQLASFRNNPHNAGRVLDRGLWRYTRHPNYFGDFCVWWGLFLVAIGCGAPWWTAVGPAIMSVFLMKFSGVGLLEKSLRHSKPDYTQYVAQTNAFFPWFPAKFKDGRPDRANP